MALYPRRRPSGGRRSRSMPARWEDDTLPRASVPSPADQEDRDELMARIGQRHREAVRTSRSEELHACFVAVSLGEDHGGGAVAPRLIDRRAGL